MHDAGPAPGGRSHLRRRARTRADAVLPPGRDIKDRRRLLPSTPGSAGSMDDAVHGSVGKWVEGHLTVHTWGGRSGCRLRFETHRTHVRYLSV
jgi:hypothetical protein